MLEIGGAVAGVLYAQPSPSEGGKKYPALAFKKLSSNTVKVTMDENDDAGKSTHSEWMGKLDERSRTIVLTMDKTDSEGHRAHIEWTGKADGRFYPVMGDPMSDELSYTITGRTLALTEKKGGRVTLTGQIAVSPNGRSFTMSRSRVNSTGRRVNSSAVYDLRSPLAPPPRSIRVPD